MTGQKKRATRDAFHVEQLSAEINEENGDISRRNTRDVRGLGDGGRAIALEFLATLY